MEWITPLDSLGMMKRQHALNHAPSLLLRATSTITCNFFILIDIRGETIVADDLGLPQSPLVSPTAPLPLHKSNDDLLSGMNNDKRKIFFDALGALCDFIKAKSTSRPGSESDGSRNESNASGTMHTTSLVEEVLIHSIDDVAALFGVPLNSLKDIDEFTKDLEVGKYDLWLKLTKETRSRISDIIWNRWDTLLNFQKSALIVDDNLSSEASPSDTIAGLEAVLEGSPWLIRKSLIILKNVFKEDGNSLIATFIGKPVMLDSYTSSMCNDSWDRSCFDWCLIEVNSEADLVDVVTIGIPSLTKDGFTKETICVEYEWMPPRCDICKICSHVHDHCLKKVVSPPIVTTSTAVTPTIEKSNDGFQMVGKKKKRKGKSKSTNGGQFAGPLVKQTVRYEPKTIGPSSKKDNISTSNFFSSLDDDEEDEDEAVENVYDESANLFPNTKSGGNSSFTAAAG
ncbi:hypothetical protein Tco_1115513 [Tanacetum coccineum]